ncbi:MAG: gamma-glutamyltransferase, partial [Pseudomonadales bacterium]
KFSKEGKAYKPGDLWVQEDLARTLERIAEDGREGFYEGETADLIVAEMQRGGGIITHEDLKNYKSVWRDPIYGTYRGYDIYGMGPPSSGGVLVQQMLNMLESYDLRRMGYGSSSLAHLMIEAERRAFADRAEYLGDPDFVNVPISILTLKEYAKYRMRDFDPDKATPSDDIGAGRWPPESPETTHFSVMDGRGMMVAFTTTLNSGYGNKVVVPGAGFLMNNEMDDFSIKPNVENQFQLTGGKANAIEPGKRMLSSVAPTIVMQGNRPVLITGSPGGSTIITTVLQVIINALDHEMPLNDAVSLPRFHNQWKPDQVLTETYTFSPETLHSLQQRGHILRPASFPLGDANSIMMKAGLMHGMSDPRGGGAAVGF